MKEEVTTAINHFSQELLKKYKQSNNDKANTYRNGLIDELVLFLFEPRIFLVFIDLLPNSNHIRFEISLYFPVLPMFKSSSHSRVKSWVAFLCKHSHEHRYHCIVSIPKFSAFFIIINGCWLEVGELSNKQWDILVCFFNSVLLLFEKVSILKLIFVWWWCSYIILVYIFEDVNEPLHVHEGIAKCTS